MCHWKRSMTYNEKDSWKSVWKSYWGKIIIWKSTHRRILLVDYAARLCTISESLLEIPDLRLIHTLSRRVLAIRNFPLAFLPVEIWYSRTLSFGRQKIEIYYSWSGLFYQMSVEHPRLMDRPKSKYDHTLMNEKEDRRSKWALGKIFAQNSMVLPYHSSLYH